MGAAVLALGSLVACDATGLVAAYQLRGVDFQTTDAAALRVAVVVPERYRPRTKDVSLAATVRMGPGDDAEEQRFSLRLSPAPQGLEEQRVASGLTAGDAFYAYRIAPGDLPQFEMFRQVVAMAKAQDGGGSLSVDTPVCRIGAFLDAPVPVRTYLRVAETGEYVLLNQIDDLRDEVEGMDINEVLPPCAP